MPSVLYADARETKDNWARLRMRREGRHTERDRCHV